METFKAHEADVWNVSFSGDLTNLASDGKIFVGEALERRCG
ncbi:WD40 repeat domain-containing protein [Microcoleus vaginatus]